MLRKNAPIGPRPAHRVFTESPAFKRWFGKSVLVRADGDPLVLLHGTSEDFTVFEKLGTTSLRPLGFWFADDPDDAEAFGDRLMPVYLRVENPYYANLGKMQEAAFGDKSWARSFREELIRKGHDGIIVRPKSEQVGRFTVREPMLVCVFDSRQVKSAIGNIGTFDKSSPDITRNPTGRGGIGRRARLKIEFPHRSASSSLAAPTINPAIDLKPFHVEPEKTTRRRARGVFDDYQYDDEVSAARQQEVQQVLDRNGLSAGRLLGTGSFASVYELKGHPERVVKVTNDPTDAAVMAEAMHAPNVQGLPRVYGVYQTPAKSYVVVMERLFPLSPGEKADVSNIVSEYERGWSIAQGWVPRTKATSGFEKAFVEALTYLRRSGFYFSDLHANNVMKREDGSYVISDLGMASVAVNKRGSRDVPLINPMDLKGRSIPDRYLAGLPPAVQKARVRELTRSRDAYRKGDYSELPSDRIARQMGLVKKSAYSEVAGARGIEWQGDEADMARRVCAHYKVKCTPAVATAIRSSFNKGLAAWKSGGHRPGATAQNWAVARVASLVVGGKTSLTADRKEFASFPAPLQKAIAAGRPDVVRALALQGRVEDARVVQGAH